MIREFSERAKRSSGGSFTFSSKALRDAVGRELGKTDLHIRRSSIRNQRLHPQYVDDVPDGQTGFGNTDYLTAWGVLYEIAWHEVDTDRYCKKCVVPGAW